MMKSLVVAVLLIGILGALRPANGDDKFRNLGFEVGVIVPIPNDPYGKVYAQTALPYWTLLVGGERPAAIRFNQRLYEGSGISILDAQCSLLGYLAGRYTVLLQAGQDSSDRATVSISQTGIVPGTAKWLVFLAQATPECYFAVLLGGVRLNPILLPTGSNCVLYTAQIAPFAGQYRTLEFRLYPPSGLITQSCLALDSVAFTALPPPNLLWLEIRRVDEMAVLTLHGTVSGQSYYIFSQSTVAGPWSIETEIVGTDGTSVQTILPVASTQSRFFAAGSATVDSDGDGLPDSYERFITLTSPNDPDSR